MVPGPDRNRLSATLGAARENATPQIRTQQTKCAKLHQRDF